MKKALMNISHSRFILFKLKIFDEIVTIWNLFADMRSTKSYVIYTVVLSQM